LIIESTTIAEDESVLFAEHIGELIVAELARPELFVFLLVEVQVEVLLVEGVLPAAHHVQRHPPV
jgi:hypothetical protein